VPTAEEQATAAGRAEPTRRVLCRRLRTVQFLFVVLMGTVLAIGPTSEFFAGDRSAVRIATLLVAAAFAALAIRVARLAAVIDGDELIVRNVFRTYHVPRAQITEIVAPAAYGRMRKAGITVRTVPGKAISISAFAQTPLDSSAGFHEAQVLSTWHDSGESRMPAPPPATELGQSAPSGRSSGVFGWASSPPWSPSRCWSSRSLSPTRDEGLRCRRAAPPTRPRGDVSAKRFSKINWKLCT